MYSYGAQPVLNLKTIIFVLTHATYKGACYPCDALEKKFENAEFHKRKLKKMKSTTEQENNLGEVHIFPDLNKINPTIAYVVSSFMPGLPFERNENSMKKMHMAKNEYLKKQISHDTEENRLAILTRSLSRISSDHLGSYDQILIWGWLDRAETCYPASSDKEKPTIFNIFDDFARRQRKSWTMIINMRDEDPKILEWPKGSKPRLSSATALETTQNKNSDKNIFELPDSPVIVHDTVPQAQVIVHNSGSSLSKTPVKSSGISITPIPSTSRSQPSTSKGEKRKTCVSQP